MSVKGYRRATGAGQVTVYDALKSETGFYGEAKHDR